MGHSYAVLGIVVRHSVIKRLERQEIPLNARLNLQAAKACGVLAYYFTLSAVNPSREIVTGWCPDHTGRWICQPLPVPNVLYGMGTTPRGSESKRAASIRAWLLRRARPINTLTKLDKRLCYEVAAGNPECAIHLPHTELYSGPEHLARVVQMYGRVLTKPLSRRSGRGIGRVTLNREGVFKWENGITGETRCFTKGTELDGFLRRQYKGQPFILQNQIELLKVSDNRADIRVLMCKDGDGAWRVARTHMWVFGNTWVRHNSVAMELIDALYHVTQSFAKAKVLYQTATQLAHTVAKEFDRVIGPMGELGLDFALDTSLKIWFLEANGRPLKEPEPCDPKESIPRQYVLVMEYAKYLCRQHV